MKTIPVTPSFPPCPVLSVLVKKNAPASRPASKPQECERGWLACLAIGAGALLWIAGMCLLLATARVQIVVPGPSLPADQWMSAVGNLPVTR